MRYMLILALLLAMGLYATPAQAHSVKGRYFRVTSTAYTPCSAGQIMADGSRVRFGSVANNFLRFGTRIRLTKPGPYGRRTFTVRDRIGYGSQLDFWVPSCRYGFYWGRRTVVFRVLR
jgi:3D (Asp-Asp-Asp) domain-containing protein